MNWAKGLLVLLGVLALSGCATVPTGPSVMVLPAQGKPFEAFQADDSVCRQWAAQQAGAGPSETAYGAGWEVQRQYDIAYQQCMYAKGNQLPGR